MKQILAAAVAATAIMAAAPVHAGASADFSGCDGLKKPKSKDDGMRGDATMSSFRFSNPRSTIAACNRALERKELKATQNLRRAHLLRARAAAHIQLSEADKALADLDRAETQIAQYRGEFFFDRSMGVSLDLLRAFALHQKGQTDEASALAERASGLRPYAVSVQLASTAVLDAVASSDTDVATLWAPIARIQPSTRPVMEARIASSSGPEAALAQALEKATDEAVEIPSGQEIGVRVAILGLGLEPVIAQVLNSLAEEMTIAYALAADGQTEKAKAKLAEVDAALNEVTARDMTNPYDRLLSEILAAYRGERLEASRALVLARMAIDEGRPNEVAGLMGENVYPASAPAKELHAKYGAIQTQSAEPLPDLPALGDPPKQSSVKLAALASDLLIKPEDPRKMIDYEKSRPDVVGGLLAGALSMGFSLLGGFDRTEGFSSEKLDNGAMKVEFTGSSTSSSIVQEMTLLRAAELTLEAGHAKFVVNDRKDFAAYWGNTIERTLTGFKTVLEFEYATDEDSQTHSIDAITVVDTLGPIYYGNS